GSVYGVDFRGAHNVARKQINAWAERQTSGRIKDLLPDGSLDHLTRLVLTNAIYFKAVWQEKFEERDTKNEEFTHADGAKVKVPTMTQTTSKARYGAFRGDGRFFVTPQYIKPGLTEKDYYPDERGFTLLEMPYKGSDLSMVL